MRSVRPLDPEPAIPSKRDSTMPISSWILHPLPGCTDELRLQSLNIPHAEIARLEGSELLVALLDTPDQTTERMVIESFDRLPALAHASLVFAHAEVAS